MLRDLLTTNKDTVVKQWQRAIMDTYPADTSNFLEKKSNRFANPVGHAIVTETGPIFDELIGDMKAETIELCLLNIIRIRAIQDFSPSHAVGFVDLLGDLIRKQVEGKKMDPELYAELAFFDNRMSQIRNAAFDIYSECRDRLAEIRVNENKRKHAKLVEKLSEGLSADSEDESHTI